MDSATEQRLGNPDAQRRIAEDDGYDGRAVMAARIQPVLGANLANSAARSLRRVTRSGSCRISRRAARDAAALGGEQAVAKTKAGVVYLR